MLIDADDLENSWDAYFLNTDIRTERAAFDGGYKAGRRSMAYESDREAQEPQFTDASRFVELPEGIFKIAQQPVDCRAEFEVRFGKGGHDITKEKSAYGDDFYTDRETEELWIGYQHGWKDRVSERESINFVDALKNAQAIVEKYPLYRKFIDGTPLQNDIAVWMAEFAINGGKT